MRPRRGPRPFPWPRGSSAVRALVLGAGAAAAAVCAASTSACSGPGGAPAEPSAPAADGSPQRVAVEVRDLLAQGEPLVGEAVLVVDGRAHPAAHGEVTLELAPGPHTLAVRRQGYRPDLFALRFSGEALPRGQALAERKLDFALRPGDARAVVWLVGAPLDVRFFVSLLDGGISRRWQGPVNLHVDRTPTPSGFVLPAERVPEIVAFVDSALRELSAGTLVLGEVSTGTGLDWEDFLNAERPGAITLQFGDLRSVAGGREMNGWGLYREASDRPGTIRSANVILNVETVRTPAREFRQWVGHEFGHALSLQHPTPCRRWSRMDGGTVTCEPPLATDLEPGSFWSRADRVAGRLVYTFLPGSDFRRLPATPPAF